MLEDVSTAFQVRHHLSHRLTGLAEQHQWTNPSQGGPCWYKDLAFWVQFFLQIMVVSAHAPIISQNEVLENSTWPWILVVLLFISLLAQRYAVEPWVPVIALLFLIMLFTPWVDSGVSVFAVFREVFVLAAYHRRPKPWLGLAFLGSWAAVIWVGIHLEETTRAIISFTIIVLVYLSLATVLGVNKRQKHKRMRLVQELAQAQARELEAEKQRAAMLQERVELAAIAERTRIARDMHDIVAHTLTGIIAQADGGRFAAKKDPQQAIAALERISKSGRGALSEVRSLLSVLRTSDERSFDIAPGFTDLPALLQNAATLGLQVHEETEGTPRPLSQAAGMAAFRVVQESLTNAAKHAGAVPVHVALHWDERALHLRISNPLSEDALVEDSQPGLGLRGLDERVRAVGGSFSAGVCDTHFVVRVSLPVEEQE